MFTIARAQVFCGSGKKLKKFRKKLARERREDLLRMSEKIKDIAMDEQRRTKEIVQRHREFFEPNKKPPTDNLPIDFFEK